MRKKNEEKKEEVVDSDYFNNRIGVEMDAGMGCSRWKWSERR